MPNSSNARFSSRPGLANLLAVGLISLACGTAGFAQGAKSAPMGYADGRESLVSADGAGVSSSLPDAPDGMDLGGDDKGQAPNKPSKRILGIIPNYRSVGVSAQLPPQTVKNKFTTALSDTVDPSSFFLAGLLAGYNDARKATPEFGHGAVAFGRYYWHSYADQAIENTSVEFLVPALTHEDTRYYTLGKGGFKKRLEYSLTRIVITRADSGKETFNFGEVVGAGVGAAASSRYYPPSQRDAGSVLQQYALNLGIDAASFVLREFDDDISRKLSFKH